MPSRRPWPTSCRRVSLRECDAGMRPGPDDPPPRSTTVIEGKAARTPLLPRSRGSVNLRAGTGTGYWRRSLADGGPGTTHAGRGNYWVTGLTNIAIPQKHSDVIADAWRADDRQLAERFRQAMRRARSELGPGGNFAAVLKRAWALDPDLRELFGDAVSSGLRKMWSDADVRAEQMSGSNKPIRRIFASSEAKRSRETGLMPAFARR